MTASSDIYFNGIRAGNGPASNPSTAQQTCFGKGGLAASTSAIGNTAFGSSALSTCNSADNTAVGRYTLQNLITGQRNTAVGNFALGGTGLTGSRNCGYGYGTGYKCSGRPLIIHILKIIMRNNCSAGGRLILLLVQSL